ncbi:hypothetical protein BX600DRAFT_472914 [Xylariales sp. PMI_506]|nr:hypothetical protein BX600DRAFT_472914 [Xylariales sp. PMI_506]
MTHEELLALPIARLLTVIITTSVTPSAPSTELLSAIVEAFRIHCASLLQCRVIVVIDNYDQVGAFARLKKGQVTAAQADDFASYKDNVKKLILAEFKDAGLHGDKISLTTVESEAEYGSPRVATNSVALTVTQTPGKRVTFIEPARRLGFGLAVRSALRMTETPYVWLQQHDWSLATDIPVEPILHVMHTSESNLEVPVKYVCFPAVRMLSYATSADVMPFPALRELTSTLKRDFTAVVGPQPEVNVPLTPLFFWHDKPHIASTAHYLARVFPSRLAMLRGDFIEDKIGQRARNQMKEGQWSKWATWLYYPDEGQQLCLRHLQGRTWLGNEAQLRQNTLYRERNCKEKLEEQAVSDEGRQDPGDFDIEVIEGFE